MASSGCYLRLHFIWNGHNDVPNCSRHPRIQQRRHPPHDRASVLYRRCRYSMQRMACRQDRRALLAHCFTSSGCHNCLHYSCLNLELWSAVFRHVHCDCWLVLWLCRMWTLSFWCITSAKRYRSSSATFRMFFLDQLPNAQQRWHSSTPFQTSAR